MSQGEKKPLKFLSNEEIKVLIGQKIGLKFLLPVAVDILKNEPLINVTYFEGDLLRTLLMLDIEDWRNNKPAYRKVCLIFNLFNILHSRAVMKNGLSADSPKQSIYEYSEFLRVKENELRELAVNLLNSA